MVQQRANKGREMNAYELADLLEVDSWYKLVTREEIATMLRQQALEIQALHKILGYEGVAVGQDYLDECVAILRKAQENG
jgi:RecA/RadA recombinase